MAGTVPKSELRSRVAGILRSPTTRKIDFRLGQWQINAAAFERVANAVTVLDIDVVVGGVSPGAEASYDSQNDALLLPDDQYGTDVRGQAGIVHECFHAFVDVMNVSGQSDSANEAAGYISYLLYLLYSAYHFPPVVAGVANLANTTMTIARSIMNTPGAVVSQQDEMALRKAIASTPHYQNKGMTVSSPANANGWSRHALMAP
jgi:hypothetical protein